MSEYFVVVIIIACAVFYYRLGEMEYDLGWLLALISVGLFLGGMRFLGLSWKTSLLVQVMFFFVLTGINMTRKRQ